MQFDLNLMLRMARRWWWILLLAPILGGTAAYVASSRQPEMYWAQTTLLVNAGITGGNNNSTIQAGQNLTETYRLWILSRPVLERAAEEIDYEGGADALQGQISSSTVPDTLFIQISASETDPELAAQVVNTVASQFIQFVDEQAAIQNSQVSGNIDAQIEDTIRRIAEIDGSVQTLQSRVGDLTQVESEELNILLANQTQLDQQLAELQTTARTIDVGLASAQTRILVSSEAAPAQQPYAPEITQSTIIGSFVGLMLGIAALALLEFLDNTVRSKEEVERITNAPILSTVANVSDIQKAGQQLFVLGSPTSGPAEAMRVLRANLEFVCIPAGTKSLVISSPGQDEGKSTLTANLGVVLAQAGVRTVIIDADLRRPTQHQIFGIDNSRGLSTLLMHRDEKWDAGVVYLNIPNLTLIPSGPLPPNPSDLLSMDRFDELIAEISETADLILIDSSPVLATSDTLVIASKSDGALLVCPTGHTARQSLRSATLALEKGAIRLVGLVINRDKSDLLEYGRYEQTAEQASASNRRFYYGGHRSNIPTTPPTDREQSTQTYFDDSVMVSGNHPTTLPNGKLDLLLDKRT